MNTREYLLLIVALLAIVFSYQNYRVSALSVAINVIPNPDFEMKQSLNLIDLRNNFQPEPRSKRQTDSGTNSVTAASENNDDDLLRGILEQRFEFINAARFSEIPSPTQFMRISMNSGL